ncbi:hypothetical protein KFE25_000378 [Diacronema lutheri]|uniref:SET domain-containing protein n=2 Tax=Diacronema lutheri TaxID=2081491 RepID=A0A8J6C9Z7_DIALT|nr:hypothetical protein KFE25_000378 [Diacronema lutheri]
MAAAAFALMSAGFQPPAPGPRAPLHASPMLRMCAVGHVSLVVDEEGAASAGVAIRPSPGRGLGAFSTRDRGVGELVGDYVGEVMSEREKDARYLNIGTRTDADELWLRSRRERGVRTSGEYILAVGSGIFIDAEDPQCANWCRYLNHDARPNVALKTLPRGLEGRPRAWFVTTRRILAGEELVFDYGDDYWNQPGDVKPS